MTDPKSSLADALAAYVRATDSDQLFPSTEVERDALSREVDAAVEQLVKRWARGVEFGP